ncbi:hypothetical protein BDL97_05G093100 [Sphagnum fallax]|nr:hypothetical protein BDL97_05G093100 [Sphagnum fallax]
MIVPQLHALPVVAFSDDVSRIEPPHEKPNENPQTLRRVAGAVNAVTPDIPSLTAILPFTGTHACIAIASERFMT